MAYKRKSYRRKGGFLKRIFNRSQSAHKRLNLKHSFGNDRNELKGNYHADVYNEQKRLGRVLTKKERKSIFNWWKKDISDVSPNPYPRFDD